MFVNLMNYKLRNRSKLDADDDLERIINHKSFKDRSAMALDIGKKYGGKFAKKIGSRAKNTYEDIKGTTFFHNNFGIYEIDGALSEKRAKNQIQFFNFSNNYKEYKKSLIWLFFLFPGLLFANPMLFAILITDIALTTNKRSAVYRVKKDATRKKSHRQIRRTKLKAESKANKEAKKLKKAEDAKNIEEARLKNLEDLKTKRKKRQEDEMNFYTPLSEFNTFC